MKKHKEGDRIKLRTDSDHYTGRYAGTEVTIITLSTSHHYTVKGFDGKEFMCPCSYFDDDDFLFYEPPKIPSICECGAHLVYGQDCPAYYHFDYCRLYRPKKD